MDCNHDTCLVKLCNDCSEVKWTCEFHRNASGNPLGHCKLCGNKRVAASRKRVMATPEGKAYKKEQDRKQNAKRTAEDRFIIQLKRFKLTPEDYFRILKEQDGKCAICFEMFTSGEGPAMQRLHIDHNHVTMKVRGLLCVNCNLMLGQAKDNTKTLLSAVQYLLREGE